MQEDVEHRTVKYCGKQTLKQLKAKEPNLANIEISDKKIGDFDRVARKYRVDYALKKDKSGPIPKYYVFFKAKDSASLDAAFPDRGRCRRHAADAPECGVLLLCADAGRRICGGHVHLSQRRCRYAGSGGAVLRHGGGIAGKAG